MSKTARSSTTSQILKLSDYTPERSSTVDREELANLIRSVLAPSDQFRLHASKVRSGRPAKIVKLEPDQRLTGNS